MPDYFVGVDIGTSGCKVGVFDESYHCVCLVREGYTVDSPKPGWVELDPNVVWESFRKCLHAALKTLSLVPSKSRFAMSFSVLGDGLIVTDKSGRPLYSGILSSDIRSVDYAKQIEDDLGNDLLSRITGRASHPMTVLPRILWAKSKLLRNKPTGIVFQDFHSWLFTRLGVGPITDYSIASGSLLFDLSTKDWSDQLLAYAEVGKDSLPQVVEAGTVAGVLREPVLAELGFPPGCEVTLVTGAMDQWCNLLGSGSVNQGDCTCSMGTVECVAIILHPSVETDALIKLGMYKAPGVRRDQFVTHALLWNGGGSLGWFCENFAKQEKMTAEKTGVSVYDIVVNPEPKAHGVFFLPHLSGSGTPWMDPLSKGAILGLTLATDVVSLANAIIEGVTFEIKENIVRLENLGVPIKSLKVVGGGSKSDKWLQLKADVLGKVVRRLAFGEAGCMGSAVLARKAMDPSADVAEIAENVVKIEREFEPSSMSEEYARKYEVYKRIYPTLRSLNHYIATVGAEWPVRPRG